MPSNIGRPKIGRNNSNFMKCMELSTRCRFVNVGCLTKVRVVIPVIRLLVGYYHFLLHFHDGNADTC